MNTERTTGPAPLFRRHPRNPILTASMWPYSVHTVFNPGAVRLRSGHTLLLCRVEDRRGLSHLCAARSKDGAGGWEIDSSPTLAADVAHPGEAWGLEDPRLSWHEELGKYSVAYCCYSQRGPSVALALTEDFRTFERIGVVLPPENKDAALFPRRIGGRWAMIHRPVPSSVRGANMWIAYSTDLRHWGDHQVLLATRPGPYWDGSKIGLSTPPIETPEGWLLTYHGSRQTVAGQSYYVGLALLDLEHPERCLRRGDHFVLAAESDYEVNGDVGNVVFPCGFTVGPDGDELNVYYGAADSCVALATARISELCTWLREHNVVGSP